MYKLLSGAKSVKQYRGDENLPEAKNGMKNCGCKHSRSKYKYQGGNKNTKAVKVTQPTKSKGEVMEDLYALMGEATGNRPEKLLRSAVIVDKNTNKAIIRAKDARNNKTVNVLTGQNRDVNARDENVSSVAQLHKNPKGRVTPTGYYKLDPDWSIEEDKKNFHGNISRLTPIPANNRRAPKSWATSMHETYDPKVRNPLYGTNKANASYGCVNITPENYKYCMQNLENKNDTLAVFDSRRPRDRDLLSRYQAVTQKARGANALAIPEGSAIVTANGGKNKQALMAYKKGNYKLLNKIIDDMPEDNVNKAQVGKQSTKTTTTTIGGNQTFDIKASKKGKAKNRLDMTKRENAGEDIWKGDRYEKEWMPKVGTATKDDAQYQHILKYLENYKGQDNATVKKILDLAKTKSPGEVKYAINKLATDKNVGPFHTIVKQAMDDYKPEETPKGVIPKDDSSLKVIEEDKKNTTEETEETSKDKFGNVPSMAEVAARSSLLAQGVENVPENYLKLGRYSYASQLPKTLQENSLAAQSGIENARDIVGGDAGRYLAQAGSLTASRMKLNNEAVIQDTLARQDILNKNVDLGNEEVVTNTGLKNQYAMQRAANRGAYNNQLVALGKAIDTTYDTAKEQENLKQADEQRMQILKDLGASGNYTWEDIGNSIRSLKAKTPTASSTTTTTTNSTTPSTPPAPQKRGAKRLKTYKRK